MSESITINKNRDLKPSTDYALLRQIGLEHIQTVSGSLWTDNNIHDPGITILEALAFAITDLGHRTDFSTENLLTDESGDYHLQSGLFTAREILHNNPLTEIDIRKFLIDVEGVRNAWVNQSREYEGEYFVNYNVPSGEASQPGSSVLESTNGDLSKFIDELNGLYHITLEFEDEITTEEQRNDVVKRARERLHNYRNLCEDFMNIKEPDGIEEIQVKAKVDISPDVDKNETLAKIYFSLQQFISPSATFYSLGEMLEKGYTVEEIFRGAPLDHGFIPTDELTKIKKREFLYTSDLLQVMMDVPGVLAVRDLTIQGTQYVLDDDGNITNTFFGDEDEWCIPLQSGIQPVLRNTRFRKKRYSYDTVLKGFEETETPLIRLYTAKVPVLVNSKEVLIQWEGLKKSLQKSRLAEKIQDTYLPDGTSQNDDYYPVQNELPEMYGTDLVGLSGNVSDKRKAQQKQLKAYLMFFEQVLVNYLAQLENVRELFALEHGDKTYYSKLLEGIKDITDLYQETEFVNTGTNTLKETELLEAIESDTEEEHVFFERKNRLLNHFLARFNERFTEYALVMFGLRKEDELIDDKIQFFKDYPVIGADRGRGFDYTLIGQTWEDDNNVTGYQKRVARFLGIDNMGHYTHAPAYDIIETLVSTDPDDVYHYHFEATIEGIELSSELQTNPDITHENALRSYNRFMNLAGEGRVVYKHIENTTEHILQVIDPLTDPIETLAESPDLGSEQNVVDAISAIENYFDTNEGLHVVEQILFRPKNATYPLFPVDLGANLDHLSSLFPPETGVGIDLSSFSFTNSLYEVYLDDSDPDYFIFYGTDNDANPVNDVELCRVQKTSNPDERLKAIHLFGADFKNYVITTTAGTPDDTYGFNIVDGESALVTVASTKFNNLETLYRTMISLVIYFYNQPEGEFVGYCVSDEDPYSFRATVLLPSWMRKSQDFAFREYAEKVIRVEAPAHVALDILWVNASEMRDFEECYEQWLYLNSLSANVSLLPDSAFNTNGNLIEYPEILAPVFDENGNPSGYPIDFDDTQQTNYDNIKNDVNQDEIDKLNYLLDQFEFDPQEEQDNYNLLTTIADKVDFLLKDRLECSMNKVAVIEDAFSADYYVLEPRNMDSYLTQNELLAYVEDPDDQEIVFADFAGGNVPLTFAKIIKEAQSLEDYKGQYGDYITIKTVDDDGNIIDLDKSSLEGERSNDDEYLKARIGDIYIYKPSVVNPNVPEGIDINVPGGVWEFFVETINVKGVFTTHKVRIAILQDFEVEVTTYPELVVECYQSNQVELPNQVVLSVSASNGTLVKAQEFPDETLNSMGLTLVKDDTEATGDVTIINSINNDGTHNSSTKTKEIGDIYISNLTAFKEVFGTDGTQTPPFNLHFLDTEGGLTNRNNLKITVKQAFVARIEVAPDIYDNAPIAKHIAKYENGDLLATIIEEDRIKTIGITSFVLNGGDPDTSGNMPPGLTLNYTQENGETEAYVEVLDQSALENSLDENLPGDTNTLEINFVVTDVCNIDSDILTLTLLIDPDKEANYILAPQVDHLGCYAPGDVLAIVYDQNDGLGIASFTVNDSDFSVLTSGPGSGALTYYSNTRAIRLSLGEVVVGGEIQQGIKCIVGKFGQGGGVQSRVDFYHYVSSLPLENGEHILRISVNTEDDCGGTTNNLLLEIPLIPDQGASWQPNVKQVECYYDIEASQRSQFCVHSSINTDGEYLAIIEDLDGISGFYDLERQGGSPLPNFISKLTVPRLAEGTDALKRLSGIQSLEQLGLECVPIDANRYGIRVEQDRNTFRNRVQQHGGENSIVFFPINLVFYDSCDVYTFIGINGNNEEIEVLPPVDSVYIPQEENQCQSLQYYTGGELMLSLVNEGCEEQPDIIGVRGTNADGSVKIEGEGNAEDNPDFIAVKMCSNDAPHDLKIGDVYIKKPEGQGPTGWDAEINWQVKQRQEKNQEQQLAQDTETTRYYRDQERNLERMVREGGNIKTRDAFGGGTKVDAWPGETIPYEPTQPFVSQGKWRVEIDVMDCCGRINTTEGVVEITNQQGGGNNKPDFDLASDSLEGFFVLYDSILGSESGGESDNELTPQ